MEEISLERQGVNKIDEDGLAEVNVLFRFHLDAMTKGLSIIFKHFLRSIRKINLGFKNLPHAQEKCTTGSCDSSRVYYKSVQELVTSGFIAQNKVLH